MAKLTAQMGAAGRVAPLPMMLRSKLLGQQPRREMGKWGACGALAGPHLTQILVSINVCWHLWRRGKGEPPETSIWLTATLKQINIFYI